VKVKIEFSIDNESFSLPEEEGRAKDGNMISLILRNQADYFQDALVGGNYTFPIVDIYGNRIGTGKVVGRVPSGPDRIS